jgi:hypothetical protein
MSTPTNTTDEVRETAQAAVTEAARIAADAARRGTETAKASIEAARSYFDETSDLGKDLYGTWIAQSESTLKAAFAAQNAALEAGLGLFDLGVKSNRQAVEQFSQLIHRSQQATLDSWQSTVKAAERVVKMPVNGAKR